MTDGARNVSVFRMTARIAEKTIRNLSSNSANIIWTQHAMERSGQRDITVLDALRILKGGYVEQSPVAGKKKGEWSCKIVKKIRGNREAGVVTVIMTEREKLLIKTVEWEDLR